MTSLQGTQHNNKHSDESGVARCWLITGCFPQIPNYASPTSFESRQRHLATTRYLITSNLFPRIHTAKRTEVKPHHLPLVPCAIVQNMLRMFFFFFLIRRLHHSLLLQRNCKVQVFIHRYMYIGARKTGLASSGKYFWNGKSATSYLARWLIYSTCLFVPDLSYPSLCLSFFYSYTALFINY